MARATKKEETKPAASQEEAAAEATETAAVDQDLIDVAEDMNKTMGLEPPIDVEASNLMELVKASASEILAADKKAMDPKSWAWLEANGMLGHLEPAKKEEKKAAPAAKPAKAAPAAESKPRYSRINAIADALKAGNITAESIEKFYVDNGGKANLEQAKADLAWVEKLVILSGGAISMAKDNGLEAK